MQIILLLLLCIECVLLSILALLKQLTKKAFVAISIATMLACSVAVIASGLTQKSNRNYIDQKQYLYMAAKLVQDDYVAEASSALSLVEDEDMAEYGVVELRGLVYNLSDSYATAASYLKGNENDDAKAIYVASKEKVYAAPEIKDHVVETVIDSLDFDQSEQSKLDAQLKIRFLAQYQADDQLAEIDEEGDFYTQVSRKIAEDNYKEAYEMMGERAANGSLKDVIVVADMYVSNFNERTLKDEDEEYDRILQEVTDAQIEMNQAYVAYAAVQDPTVYNDNEYKLPEEIAYEKAMSRYQVAYAKLDKESALRAINYMIANAPQRPEKNLGYQYQMARLYYLTDNRDAAKECLSNIFATEDIDENQWMGLELNALKEGYLESLSTGSQAEFQKLFSLSMVALNQGILSTDNNDYRDFVRLYLDELYYGIHIGNIDVSHYPEVAVEVSAFSEDLELSKDDLLLTDTDEQIKDFDFVEMETEAISICYVLDRSGSMSGSDMTESKRAIQNGLSSLKSDTRVGLVSFESSARVDCGMTYSTAAITGALAGVQASGGTSIASGLEMAYTLLQPESGERVIILLSDGQDGNTNQIQATIQKLASEGIKVYTIGLGTGCDAQYLSNIANQTGGSYSVASNASQLDRIYDEIQTVVSSGYLITYTATAEDDYPYVHLRMKDSLVQTRKEYRQVEEEADKQPETDNYNNQQSGFYRQFAQ